MSFSPHLVRIMKDIINFEKNKIPGIEIWVNQKDITQIYALIFGNKNTPYQHGLFFFELKFSEEYPKKNPTVKFLTINNKIRFNPNLYENGKVCLSILGTWTGPGWTSIMTLSSVLLSLQSLFHENPITNEPGFENTKIESNQALNYNNYLRYWTIKLAILEIMENPKYKDLTDKFIDKIKAHLMQNIEEIINDVKTFAFLFNDLDLSNQNNIYYFKDYQILKFTELEKFLLELKSKIEN
jgi:ubiquitin-conjugating enzyme E2 Z